MKIYKKEIWKIRQWDFVSKIYKNVIRRSKAGEIIYGLAEINHNKNRTEFKWIILNK